MSTAGKVFIVINLVLAALFVGSAASLIGTSDEYRKKWEDEKSAHASAVQALQAELGDANQRAQEFERQAGDARTNLQRTEADVANLNSEVLDERKRNTDLNESVSGIQAKLGDLEQTNRQHGNRIAELENENRSLREERDRALLARDAALSARTAAETAQRTAMGDAEKLRKDLAFAVDRADEAEAQLATMVRISGMDPAAIEGIQPDLEGIVLSTSYDADRALVQINLGQNDKVLRGYTFDVYNTDSSQYKGKVKVEIVRANSSTCTVTLAAGAKIAAGDRVATNL